MSRPLLPLALVVVAITLLAPPPASAVTARKGQSGTESRAAPPALFVLGDSIFDVGNNDFLPNCTARADFPHNGVDFPGGTPTGRFSNGYNLADYLAKFYGLAKSPPAFLSLTKLQVRAHMLSGGINFASGGSGILDATGSRFVEVISTDEQIEQFRKSLEDLRSRQGSATAREHLRRQISKSVFIISTGSNDLFEFHASGGASQSYTTVTAFITALASKQVQQIRTLYSLGARRFGIVSTGMIGCCPAYRRLSPSGDCLDELNDLSFLFYSVFRQALEDLSSESSGMKYSLGNGHGFGSKIIRDPSALGFEAYKSACCGAGTLNGEAACTPDAALCSDREHYYFWDLFHPSDSASKLQADVLYHGSLAMATPVNFGQLRPADDDKDSAVTAPY